MAKWAAAITIEQANNPRFREENLTKLNEYTMTSFQQVAADATAPAGNIVRQGRLIDVRVTIGPLAAAAGESMTIDVLRVASGGVPATMLSAVISIPAGTPSYGTISGLAAIPNGDSALPAVTPGDQVLVTRDYTAGGGPAPITATTVTLVFA